MCNEKENKKGKFWCFKEDEEREVWCSENIFSSFKRCCLLSKKKKHFKVF